MAEDQGALCYYYVVVAITDSEDDPGVRSSELQVAYADELMNGAFEEPENSGNSDQWAQSSVPYWSTTASDGKIEIGKHTADDLTYGAVLADGYEGAQFAELNAGTAGSLYQDVLTAENTQLYWGLLHRARNANGWSSFVGETSTTYENVVENTSRTQVTTYTATDTMYVVIMSTSDAEKLLDGVSDSDQQNVLTAMITSILGSNDSGSGTYTLVTGNSAGQTVTATIWKITTTSTVSVYQNQTYKYNYYSGWHWEDDGEATYSYSEWVSYSGEYTVPEGQYLTRFFFVAGSTQSNNNTVGNLLDDVYFSQNMRYTIEYWVWDDATQKYVLQSGDTETGTVDPYSNVSASSLSNYSDYALVGSVTGTSSGGSNPSSFDDTTKTKLHVTSSTNFLSLYFKNTGVTVVKEVKGLSAEQLEELTDTDSGEGYSVTASLGSTTVDIVVDETGTGAGYVDLSTGTYTVSETNCPETVLNGTYKLASTTITGTGVTQNQDGTYSLTLDTETPSTTITITNTYAPATVDVTLKKVDESGKALTGATFTLTDGTNATVGTYSVTDASGTVTMDELTVNSSYTLTETVAPDGYNLLTSSISFTVTSDGVELSGESEYVKLDENDSFTIIVTNKAGYVLPSTGGTGTWMYTLTGLTLCGAALVLWRRRETD